MIIMVERRDIINDHLSGPKSYEIVAPNVTDSRELEINRAFGQVGQMRGRWKFLSSLRSASCERQQVRAECGLA